MKTEKPEVINFDLYVSTADAAKLLGMTRSGVVRLINRRKLPVLKLSDRFWLIEKAALLSVRKSKAGRPRKD